MGSKGESALTHLNWDGWYSEHIYSICHPNISLKKGRKFVFNTGLWEFSSQENDLVGYTSMNVLH